MSFQSLVLENWTYIYKKMKVDLQLSTQNKTKSIKGDMKPLQENIWKIFQDINVGQG